MQTPITTRAIRFAGLPCLLFVLLCSAAPAQWNPTAGDFQWTLGPPVLSPLQRPGDTTYSVKDPTIVRFDGRWHLFCSIRGKERSHQIEYISFRNWDETDRAERHILGLTDGYYCAPQVFYFTPQKKWYLICQVIDQSRKPALQPAFSTSDNIADPGSWTSPTLVFKQHPDNISMWIDFWVICDNENAHLFFTSLDGRMFRSQTALADFPHGWDRPRVALKADIFEASHTYRVNDLDKYLTIVEAQRGGRRYYKAYMAPRLDGIWRPLAATPDKPFASPANITDTGPHWADSISHGELIRAGFDEKLEVDLDSLEMIFQGVTDERMAGKKYGEIPWQLGLLKAKK
jgi:hypothetical protein